MGPKIRLEQTRLDTLRPQKVARGVEDAKGAKKIDKKIEGHEALLGELQDFVGKPRRSHSASTPRVPRRSTRRSNARKPFWATPGLRRQTGANRQAELRQSRKA